MLVPRSPNFIGNNEGQCDAIVETNDTIILIEVKKKPLTRKARAGSDSSLLLDLTQSLLEAQVQAGNHELRLRQDGYLDLDDNGTTHRIELKERKVERIALSFTDYGSFHDRIFLDKFLTAISQLHFTTSDPKYKKQFEEIADLITSLQKQAQHLYHATGSRPYFNCWFFSLPQLLVLLDGVNCAEGLREALWSIKGLGTGKGDLCWDIRYAEIMKKQANRFTKRC